MKVLGTDRALEYMQFLQDINDLVGVKDSTGVSIQMADFDTTEISEILANISSTPVEQNLLTKPQAEARWKKARDQAVYNDIQKVLGDSLKTEVENLLKDIASRDPGLNQNIVSLYENYFFQYYKLHSGKDYQDKLYELRWRVLLLRFNEATKDLPKTIEMNMLLEELLTYEQ